MIHIVIGFVPAFWVAWLISWRRRGRLWTSIAFGLAVLIGMMVDLGVATFDLASVPERFMQSHLSWILIEALMWCNAGAAIGIYYGRRFPASSP